MTPLLLLAEKVEGLSGPDREVDAEIAAALRVGTEHGWALRYPAWIAAKDGRVHLEKNGPSFAAPAFTASLDAAMSLVPEGWRIWTADFSIEGRFVWMLCGPKLTWITHEDGSREGGEDWYQSGVAATPALALVSASLRARAAMEAGE